MPLLRLKVKTKIKTTKNNLCHWPSCQRLTSGLEDRPHVNTRIPQGVHHPHLNNLGWVAHGLYKQYHLRCMRWNHTTAGTAGGGTAAGTGSAEAGATTGGRSDGGAGAVDWWYRDNPVRVTCSIILLDGYHKQIVSSSTMRETPARRFENLAAHVLKIWRQNIWTN